MRRWALITGASAGIGAAFCRVFARNGFDIVLTARRENKLRELASDLERDHGVATQVVTADLADPAAPERIFAFTEARGLPIAALVNNAGLGSTGAFREVSWVEHAAFIQVLVTAVAHLTHLYEPGMTARGYGRIVNVASLAALVPGTPSRTLYGAAKSFVVKLSEALAQEHEGDGVQVSCICPGFTHSEFHDVAGTRAQVSKLPSYMWMDADEVAQQGYDAVMSGRTVMVNGAPNRALATLVRVLPGALSRRLIAGRAKDLRPSRSR